jgi:uncharacterized membrane protein YgaE (UPF0421/DUF939 family)
MNDIQVSPPNQSMQMLAELFTNALPSANPPMQFQGGLVNNFFHNWKLKQLEKASDHEATIAINHYWAGKAKLNLVQDFITFQSRTTDIFKEFEHREETRKLERALVSEQLNKIKLENQALYFETRISEMEFKKREKEFKEEYEDKKDDN